MKTEPLVNVFEDKPALIVDFGMIKSNNHQLIAQLFAPIVIQQPHFSEPFSAVFRNIYRRDFSNIKGNPKDMSYSIHQFTQWLHSD